MMRILFLLSFLISCSSIKNKNIDEQRYFTLKDVSGDYSYKLHQKVRGDKIFIEKLVTSFENSEILESSYVLNKVDKSKKFWIPTISQTKMWIERKKYFSQFKIIPKLKVYSLDTDQIKKLKGVKFIKEKFICAFSILPICIENFLKIHRKQLEIGKNLKIGILWDQYPMTKLVYSNDQMKPLESFQISLVGLRENLYYFNLENAGTLVSVILDEKYKFHSLHWVAEGLSLELK